MMILLPGLFSRNLKKNPFESVALVEVQMPGAACGISVGQFVEHRHQIDARNKMHHPETRLLLPCFPGSVPLACVVKEQAVWLSECCVPRKTHSACTVGNQRDFREWMAMPGVGGFLTGAMAVCRDDFSLSFKGHCLTADGSA